MKLTEKIHSHIVIQNQFFITLGKTNQWNWGGTCQAPGPWTSFSCLSGKGRDAETREEQPRNNSAALGQSPGPASVQFSSVPQSCPTLHDHMDCSMQDLLITNSWRLLKLISIESVMPSSHLILCRLSLLLPIQHQDLFQWVSSLHQVAKVLDFQLQQQSFQWTLRTGWISLQSKGLSSIFSNTTVQKYQSASRDKQRYLWSLLLMFLLFSYWVLHCCTPGFSVLHYLPEFAQFHVHWVNDMSQ